MSDRLAQATTFTVETTDTRERSRGGQKVTAAHDAAVHGAAARPHRGAA